MIQIELLGQNRKKWMESTTLENGMKVPICQMGTDFEFDSMEKCFGNATLTKVFSMGMVEL